MYVIGDIGNTETKICVYSSQKKIIKKIILKSNLITNNYLKNKLIFIYKKKSHIKKVIFSSVVPKKFKLIKSKISKAKLGKGCKIIEPVNIYECKIGNSVFIGPFVEVQKNETSSVHNESRVRIHPRYPEVPISISNFPIFHRF